MATPGTRRALQNREVALGLTFQACQQCYAFGRTEASEGSQRLASQLLEQHSLRKELMRLTTALRARETERAQTQQPDPTAELHAHQEHQPSVPQMPPPQPQSSLARQWLQSSLDGWCDTQREPYEGNESPLLNTLDHGCGWNLQDSTTFPAENQDNPERSVNRYPAHSAQIPPASFNPRNETEAPPHMFELQPPFRSQMESIPPIPLQSYAACQMLSTLDEEMRSLHAQIDSATEWMRASGAPPYSTPFPAS